MRCESDEWMFSRFDVSFFDWTLTDVRRHFEWNWITKDLDDRNWLTLKRCAVKRWYSRIEDLCTSKFWRILNVEYELGFSFGRDICHLKKCHVWKLNIRKLDLLWEYRKLRSMVKKSLELSLPTHLVFAETVKLQFDSESCPIVSKVPLVFPLYFSCAIRLISSAQRIWRRSKPLCILYRLYLMLFLYLSISLLPHEQPKAI